MKYTSGIEAGPPLLDGPYANGEVLTPLDASTIKSETVRAQRELWHAINKHRLAWAKMERLATEYKDKGNAYFKDNERPWKLAVGDVQWWRGEMSAQSNTLTALLALAASRDLDSMDGWAEITSFRDGENRVFMPTRQRARDA